MREMAGDKLTTEYKKWQVKDNAVKSCNPRLSKTTIIISTGREVRVNMVIFWHHGYNDWH
jgi:hypothetical protein